MSCALRQSVHVISHAANGDIVIGATPTPTDTSDTARPRCSLEPADHRGDHRREEAADRDADQQAERELELERALRAARERQAQAEEHRPGQHDRARADAVAERAPAEAGAPIARKLSVMALDTAGVRPAGRLRDRLQEHREREHRADRDARHERAQRHHHPAPADEVAAERARVATEGAGARLLALQGPTGGGAARRGTAGGTPRCTS